ncbi:hypothetical protein AB4564_23585, partial [Vibrio sp. 10N.222.51.E8]|uniref:hypothetical protein n=1 Tax=unclassified Vibrio TaxID=2614977 RepID=UPI0019CF7720
VSWGVTGTPTSFRSTCFSFLLAQYRSSKFVTGFNFEEKRKIFFQEYTIKDSVPSGESSTTDALRLSTHFHSTSELIAGKMSRFL